MLVEGYVRSANFTSHIADARDISHTVSQVALQVCSSLEIEPLDSVEPFLEFLVKNAQWNAILQVWISVI